MLCAPQSSSRLFLVFFSKNSAMTSLHRIWHALINRGLHEDGKDQIHPGSTRSLGEEAKHSTNPDVRGDRYCREPGVRSEHRAYIEDMIMSYTMMYYSSNTGP